MNLQGDVPTRLISETRQSEQPANLPAQHAGYLLRRRWIPKGVVQPHFIEAHSGGGGAHNDVNTFRPCHR